MPAIHPVTVTTGRHPWQVMSLAGIGCAGVAMLATGLVPRSMQGLHSPPLVYCWEALLALGGVAGLVGTWWRGELEIGLIIEGGAHLMVACMLTFFVVVAVTTNPTGALAVGLFIGGMSAAGWWRVAQVWRDVRRLNRATASGTVATVPLLVEPPDATP
jgi:hypothetical protein